MKFILPIFLFYTAICLSAFQCTIELPEPKQSMERDINCMLKGTCPIDKEYSKKLDRIRKCEEKCDKKYKKVEPFKTKREKINKCQEKCE